MALIKKYQKGGVSIIPEGGWENRFEKEIGAIDSYISKDYGDNEDYAISSLAKLNNADLKKYLFNKVKNVSQDYVNRYNSAPDKDTWKNITEVNSLLSNISNIDPDNMSDDDWNKIVAFSGGLGWDLPGFFSQTDEQEQEQIALANEEAKRKSQLDQYAGLGVSDETIRDNLYAGGFTKINEGLDPYISDYLKEKGYNYFRNENDDTIVLDSKGRFAQEGFGLLTEDQFSEDYGKIFNISEGVLNIDQYSDKYKDLLPKFEDLGNLRKRLILSEDSDLGEFDPVVYGDSSDDFYGNVTRDLFGRRDYTSAITLTRNGEPVRATRRDDGSYITDDGEVINVSFTGFGEESEQIHPTVDQALFDNPNLPNWSKIDPKNPNTWGRKVGRSFFRFKSSHPTKGAYDGWFQGFALSLDNIDNQLKEIEQDLTYADRTGRDISSDIQGKTKKIGEFLRHYIELGNQPNASPEEKAKADKAFQLASRLSKVWSTKDASGNQLITFRREGGTIRKLQTGDTLTQFLEDSKRSGNTQRKSKITGTRSGTALKDASLTDWISLGATGASFIPGLGVVGGAVSTVADAIGGAKDGWDRQDTKNLLANIGFTALGVVGLGGAAKLGVKALKQADTVGDAAKLAGRALSKSKKLGPGGKGISEATERFAKAVGTKGDDATKLLDRVRKGEKISGYKGTAEEILQQITSDAELVSRVAKMPTTWTGQQAHLIGEGVKSLGKTLPKVGKVALTGHQIYQGGAGAVGVGQSIAEHGLWEGLAEANVHDIRRAAQLGSVATSGVRNWRVNRAIGKNTQTATEGKHTLKIGENDPIQIKGQLLIPKAQSLPKRTFTKLSAEDKTKVGKSKLTPEQFDKFSKDLGKMLGENSDNFKNALEIIRTQGLSGLRYQNIPGQGLVLNQSPASNSLSDILSYNRAARALRAGSSNTARLPWFRASRSDSSTSTNTPTNTPTSSGPQKLLMPANTSKNQRMQELGIRGNAIKQFNKRTVDTSKLSSKTKELLEKFYKGSSVPKSLKVGNLSKSSNLYKSIIRDLTSSSSPEKLMVMKDGGVLKLRIGGGLSGIDGFVMPGHLPKRLSMPQIQYGELRYSNPNAPQLHWTQRPLNTNYQFNPTLGQTSKKSEAPSTIDDYNNQDYNKKPFVNLEPLANLAKFGIGERYNNLTTNARIQAALQTPRLNTRSQVHLSTYLPNTLRAQAIAGNLRSQAGKLGRATSDFNAAAGISLSGNMQAANIEQEGFARDMDANNATRLEQARINSEVDAYNSQVMDKNSALAAQARQNVFNLIGNHRLQQGHNRQVLAESLYKSTVTHPYKKMGWDYYQEMQDPNIQSDAERYTYLTSDEVRDTYKAQYEQELERAKAANPNVVDPGWENSEQYKAWQNSITNFRTSNIDPRYSRLTNLANMINVYRNNTMMFQKGGRIPFAEKAALENIKYNNKRLLEYERNYYNKILKKSELLQKAMVKVFK